MPEPPDIGRSEIQAISEILQRLYRLEEGTSPKQGTLYHSPLLRFALTDAFNSGARIAARAVAKQLAPEALEVSPAVEIKTLHTDVESLLQRLAGDRAQDE